MGGARTALMALATVCMAAHTGHAGVEYPERPGERDFIVDEAGLIEPEDAERIRGLCDTLLTDMAVPIIVVTIPSLRSYGAKRWTIERYASNLFDEWGIGYQKWNHGILLLVSVDDRKARIELGADYAGTHDDETRQIMNELIIPRFKQGDYSAGIYDGVRGLDAMARGLEIPTPPRPWWHYLLWLGFVGLGIFTAVSLYRRGASGWAWLFWGALFTVLFFILRAALSRSSSGGGFSGGSFGGGSSGGGGATGSW